MDPSINHHQETSNNDNPTSMQNIMEFPNLEQSKPHNVAHASCLQTITTDDEAQTSNVIHENMNSGSGQQRPKNYGHRVNNYWRNMKQKLEEYEAEIEDNLKSRMVSFKQLHPNIDTQKMEAMFHMASELKVNLDEPRFIEATMALMGKLMLAYHAAQQWKTASGPKMPMPQIMASRMEIVNQFTKPKQENMSEVIQDVPPHLQKTVNAAAMEAPSFNPLETLSVPGNLAQGTSFILQNVMTRPNQDHLNTQIPRAPQRDDQLELQHMRNEDISIHRVTNIEEQDILFNGPDPIDLDRIVQPGKVTSPRDATMA
ncbi:hypothetical protein BDQ17DRAFT_1425671 [Cyathus striatus]|nr:hypothetical protein BDQ17DRAFT_1425671 [Cyathus striatus]